MTRFIICLFHKDYFLKYKLRLKIFNLFMLFIDDEMMEQLFKEPKGTINDEIWDYVYFNLSYLQLNCTAFFDAFSFDNIINKDLQIAFKGTTQKLMVQCESLINTFEDEEKLRESYLDDSLIEVISDLKNMVKTLLYVHLRNVNTLSIRCLQLDFTDGGAGVCSTERMVRFVQTIWVLINS